MGLGSTAKKIQLLAERAEQLYSQVGELRDQIHELRETVEATGRKVDTIETRNERQWVVLRQLAEEQGIDVDVVLAEASIETVEDDDDASNGDVPADDEGDSDES